MLSANNLMKKYDGFTAIENIDFCADKGCVYGLIGYNGAGKSTLMKILCGVLKPDRGTVTLDGQTVFDNADAKSRLIFVPDAPYLPPQASMKYMAKFYRSYYTNWNDKLFTELATIFGLDENKRISGFSKGMQKQAFIIFALSMTADYLLLDETFDGLDPNKREMVRRLLLTAIAERGMSVIISSHNLHELESLCDRVSVINGRRIAYDVNVRDMCENKNKYRVVFAEEFDEQALLDELGLSAVCKQVKREGKILSFVADGAVCDIKGRLTAKPPLLIETFPLSLEEIFMLELDDKSYDFTGLFKNKFAEPNPIFGVR